MRKVPGLGGCQCAHVKRRSRALSARCVDGCVVVAGIGRARSSNGCDLRSGRHPEMVVGREWVKRTGVEASRKGDVMSD